MAPNLSRHSTPPLSKLAAPATTYPAPPTQQGELQAVILLKIAVSVFARELWSAISSLWAETSAVWVK
jgi:hypothetical protein